MSTVKLIKIKGDKMEQQQDKSDLTASLRENLEQALGVPVFTGPPIAGLADEKAGEQDRFSVDAAVESMIKSMRGDETGYVDAENPSDMVIDIRGFDLRAALLTAFTKAAMVKNEATPFTEPGEYSVFRNEDGIWEHTFKPYRQEA